MKPLFVFCSSIAIFKLFSLRSYKITNIWSNLVSTFISWNKSIDIPKLSPNEQFISIRTKRFLDSYNNTTNSFNENIDPCFYNKESLTKLLNTIDNPLEKQWKRRVIFDNTPYGNVIMAFSPYKMGFEYYSGTSSIPYSVLNAMAMKYCITFFCRDLFVDDSATPEGHHSKLIPIHFTEIPDKPDNKTDKKSHIGINNSQAFAKFKNYSKSTKTYEKKVHKTDEKKDDADTKITTSNRFVYLGKQCNYTILQPIKHNNNNNGFYTKLLDNVVSEPGIQQKKFDYKAFKLAQSKN